LCKHNLCIPNNIPRYEVYYYFAEPVTNKKRKVISLPNVRTQHLSNFFNKLFLSIYYVKKNNYLSSSQIYSIKKTM